VDEPLGKLTAAVQIDGIAVEIVLDDIAGCDQGRCQRSRYEVTVGIPVVPNADMPERVHDALPRQDPAGRNEVFHQSGIRRAGR
jgi:hypothetical protein